MSTITVSKSACPTDSDTVADYGRPARVHPRVSTLEQNSRLQTDALKSAGCYRVFTDRASRALDERRELAKLFDQARPGDTVVVWRLDRLGRSLRHLIEGYSQDKPERCSRPGA